MVARTGLEPALGCFCRWFRRRGGLPLKLPELKVALPPLCLRFKLAPTIAHLGYAIAYRCRSVRISPLNRLSVSDGQPQPFASSPVLYEPQWLSRRRTIRQTTSLNDSAPRRVDLDGEHVVKLLTPTEPE